MKKLLVVLLALTMVFAFAACGEQADTETAADEGLTAIPLGGDLGEYVLEGDAYGTYVQVDFPEDVELSESCVAQLYYAEGCNTPYIAVYRWANDEGNTLEEETAYLSEAYDAAEYKIYEWEELGQDEAGGFTIGYTDTDGNYYYVECNVLLDGEEFVEIDFYCATEEIALGESGQYLWVPAGYNDLMNDNEAEHGTVFYGEYDESYYLPGIWVGLEPKTYEDMCWFLSEDYEETPIDEASFNKWVAAEWDKASCDEYYKALGFTEVNYYGGETNGIKIDVCACNNDEEYYDDIYFTVDGVDYIAILYTSLNPAPVYAKVLTDSLHTK